MEVARNLLSSSPSPFPARTHLKNSPLSSSSSSSSSSVLAFHEQAASGVTSIPINSVARHFPTSVLIQEQRDEYRSISHFLKEDKTYQGATDKKQAENGSSIPEEETLNKFRQSGQMSSQQLFQLPSSWLLSKPSEAEENLSSSLLANYITTDADELIDYETYNVVSLAKKALSASQEAMFVAKDLELCETDHDGLLSTRSSASSSLQLEDDEVISVRSTRHLERCSKRRRVPRSKVTDHATYRSSRADVQKRLSEGYDPNDPLRLFLWGPETKQLLTAKEESELISKVQDLMKLEKVKSKLQSQFGREPTSVEWAEAVGISCPDLRLELHWGNSSREKLVYANLRMVVHIAKQYTRHGVNLQDLLQEGSMGLMKSIEKFKPQVGCRFATYAYWWIRQTIRKAIFQHSRTVRLPENVYGLLSKAKEANRSCIQEGNHTPSKEELARRVGITVDKLNKLLYSTRMPVSMQQPVWADQDTTFQEVTADSGVENPDISVAKQLMRQHVHNLLSILSPKERRIIKLRFGMKGGKQYSLSEIGDMFGLSKERVRQLESRALYKLKQCLGSQGLDAYADLLI